MNDAICVLFYYCSVNNNNNNNNDIVKLQNEKIESNNNNNHILNFESQSDNIENTMIAQKNNLTNNRSIVTKTSFNHAMADILGSNDCTDGYVL